MEHWTAAELEIILKAPKRRHVEMLVAEVLRLTEIARAADQDVNATMAGCDVQRRIRLRELLKGTRTAIPD